MGATHKPLRSLAPLLVGWWMLRVDACAWSSWWSPACARARLRCRWSREVNARCEHCGGGGWFWWACDECDGRGCESCGGTGDLVDRCAWCDAAMRAARVRCARVVRSMCREAW